MAFAPNPSSNLVIGASNLSASGEHSFFPGVITDVAVYDTALDFHTIQSHFMTMMTGDSM